MELFDGNLFANSLDLKIDSFLQENTVTSKLLIILIGDHAPSEKFVGIKETYCKKHNIPVEIMKVDKDKSDEEIISEVTATYFNTDYSGIVIQLPLPRPSLYGLLENFPKEKDVDLIGKASLDDFYNGIFDNLPPVVRSFDSFIKKHNISLTKDTRVGVVGGGFLVGKPLEFFLRKNYSCNVFVINNYYPGQRLDDYDILILSAGVGNMVKGENIKEHTSVIDFGSSVIDNKTVGDLDLNSHIDPLNFISPSPGGMGPLVIRFLILNHLGL